MTKRLAAASLLLSLPLGLFAQNPPEAPGLLRIVNVDPPTTVLSVKLPPTPRRVGAAMALLAEALQASRRGDEATYGNDVARAKTLLEPQTVKKSFPAQIRCGRRNAFPKNMEGYEHDCDIRASRLCYLGERSDALELVVHALAAEYWNWDEDWVEKPRIESDKLLIDIVDGPNEGRETREIQDCKTAPKP